MKGITSLPIVQLIGCEYFVDFMVEEMFPNLLKSLKHDKNNSIGGREVALLSEFNCRNELIKKMESYKFPTRSDFKLINCKILIKFIVDECLQKKNQEIRNIIMDHFTITRDHEVWIDIYPKNFDIKQFATIINMDREEKMAKKRAIEEMDEDTLLKEANAMGLLRKSDFSNCLKKRKSSTIAPILDMDTLTSIQIFQENQCVCPLSKQVFKHAVLAPDGIIYDKKSIDDWMEKNGKKSPITSVPFQHLNFMSVKYINDKCQDLIRKQVAQFIEIMEQPERYPQFTSINLLELIKYSLTFRPNIDQELALKRLRICIIEKDSKVFLIQDEDILIFIDMMFGVCSMIERQPTISEAEKQEQLSYCKRILDLTKDRTSINRACAIIANMSSFSLEQIYEKTIKFGQAFFQQVSSNLFGQSLISFEVYSSFTSSKLAEPYQIAIGGYFTDTISKIKSKKNKK